jgi:hypothetical protein
VSCCCRACGWRLESLNDHNPTPRCDPRHPLLLPAVRPAGPERRVCATLPPFGCLGVNGSKRPSTAVRNSASASSGRSGSGRWQTIALPPTIQRRSRLLIRVRTHNYPASVRKSKRSGKTPTQAAVRSRAFINNGDSSTASARGANLADIKGRHRVDKRRFPSLRSRGARMTWCEQRGIATQIGPLLTGRMGAMTRLTRSRTRGYAT